MVPWSKKFAKEIVQKINASRYFEAFFLNKNKVEAKKNVKIDMNPSAKGCTLAFGERLQLLPKKR